MKFTFDSKGKNYLHISRTESGKIQIILSAQDPNNKLKSIVNSAEINEDEWQDIVKELDPEK